MTTLTLIPKRQATFPKETCEAPGLKPGDVIELDFRDEGSTKIWILRPRPALERGWADCIGTKAEAVTDHSMDAVRESISAGRVSKV